MCVEVLVSQLNLYVTNELKAQLQAAAEKEGKTISSFVVEIIKSRFMENDANGNYFSKFFGVWEGPVPDIERPLPQKRDKL